MTIENRKIKKILYSFDEVEPSFLPFLQMREEPPFSVKIVIQRPSIEGDDPNPSGCPLYDYENKICNLYSMQIQKELSLKKP